jgi:hypothetical protein
MIRQALIYPIAGMLLAACATADGGGDDDTVDSGIVLRPDASMQQGTPDAMPQQGTPDAMPQQSTPDAMPMGNPVPITLSHSTSQNIVSLNSVACSNQTTGATRENHYYRIFDLGGFGVTSALTVTSVDVAIETAVGAAGSQSATLIVHTLTGTLETGTLTPITTLPVTVTDQDLTILNIPIAATVPAGSQMVIEFSTPDGDIIGNTLYIGSNSLGESSPSYLTAVDCGINTPSTTTSIGFPEMQIVMNVQGTHIP